MAERQADAPEFWFYQIETEPVGDVIAALCERILARGWRAAIKIAGSDNIGRLDGHLWTFRANSFLPHGRSDAVFAARQPLLLCGADNAVPANAPDCVLLWGAPIPAALSGVQRVVILLDPADPDAVAAARAQWRTLKGSGAAISYWRQDADGKWQKQG